MKKFLGEQWFLLVLLGVVWLGYSHPGPGEYVRQRVEIKWFIVPTLFLMSFSLEAAAILRSFLNWRGLASSILGGYFLTSLSLYLLAKALVPQHQDLVLGLIAVGSTPCTLASATIWTRLSGGNDALALAITVVSNLSSFIFSPLILMLALGSAVAPPMGQIMGSLFMVIVIPVGAGQLLRMVMASYAERWKPVIGVLCRLLILLVVIVAVSRASRTAAEAQAAGGMTVFTLLLLVIAVVAAHGVAFAGCGLIAWMVGAPMGDVVAVMFGGSQKTLPVGIYIAEMLAASRPDEALVFIALPILIYHASQLIVDSFLIGVCRRRLVGMGE